MRAVENRSLLTELRGIIRRERLLEIAFKDLRLTGIRRWYFAESLMPGNKK